MAVDKVDLCAYTNKTWYNSWFIVYQKLYIYVYIYIGWLEINAYEPLRVIQCQIVFIHIYTGWLVVFYGITNIDGYLIPNPVYTYT